jgi:hypothetical protein
LKKFFAIAGIAAGTVAIVAGIITLVRDGRGETPVTVIDDDGLIRRMVEEGENVIRLQSAA